MKKILLVIMCLVFVLGLSSIALQAGEMTGNKGGSTESEDQGEMKSAAAADKSDEEAAKAGEDEKEKAAEEDKEGAENPAEKSGH